MNNDDKTLIAVPIPSLVATFLNTENEKGTPLTEDEVNTIRDNATCVMLSLEMVHGLIESRGYRDINPDQAWEHWQDVRDSMEKPPEQIQE